MFKCPGDDKSYVSFDFLCDGVESCGDADVGENKVCRISRDLPVINSKTSQNGTLQNACVSSNGTCEVREFRRPWGLVFGEDKMELFVPSSKVHCRGLFGEYYLYLSCMDLCLEMNAKCPLEGEQKKLLYDSCPFRFTDRAYTLANNSFLTFLDDSEGGKYHQNAYRCNNTRCVDYNQVCDLIDDCGDMSDELNCVNHMVCEDTSNSTRHQFISLSQKCDGLYDCFDLSDECNERCGKEILGNWVIKMTSWFMGILAMLFNLFTVINGLPSLESCETEQMLISKLLIILIGSGDFLIGIYLVILSIYDSIIFGKEFCRKQAEWLTGTPCKVLGVISTLGSQISLFAMTVLSVIRMYGITCKPMTVPGPVDKKSMLKAIPLALLTITASLAIAITPLTPSLEDYFVQGMHYNSSYKVFIGFPNKERHVNILQTYYVDSNLSSSVSWKEIGDKVDGMFSRDHGSLSRRPVHFYGNDGVCLFKYFVRTEDARRSRQSSDIAELKEDPVV